MDLALYPKQKAEGQVTVQHLAACSFQLIIRKYDPYTRKETTPELFAYDDEGITRQIAKVDEAIANLQKSKDGMLMLQADMKAMLPKA